MASSEFDNEDTKVDGTQEAVLSTNDAPIPLPNGSIWDPVSKSVTHRTQDDQPTRFQVPGTPVVDQDFTMKTKNPEYEGVFARTAAVRVIALDASQDDFGVYSDRARGEFGTPLVYRGTLDQCRQWVREKGHTATFEPVEEPTGYRQAAEEFWQMAENEPNPSRQRQYAAKAEYYERLAEKYEPKANDPATTQAVNGAPAASDATDVYQDRTPKHNLQDRDDSFPGMISSRTPKVTSTMLNTGRNSYQEPDAPNLRDCPEAGCGGKMQDTNDESHCHDCGHKEKVHYAAGPIPRPEDTQCQCAECTARREQAKSLHKGGLLAPLAIGAEALEGAAAVGEGAEAAGAAGEAAGAAEGAGGGGASNGAMNLNTGVRAANLMNRVMNGGQKQGEGDGMVPEVTSGGSPYADDSMGHNASSVADEEGLYSYDNDGDDSNPKAGNKGSEGQDENAPELAKDEDTSTGGSASPLSGIQLFEVLEPYLLSIADKDDSSEDPIAKALHELLLSEDPEYMSKAAKVANVTCPSCHIDLSGNPPCGNPDTSVACPVNASRANQTPMQTGVMGMPATSVGQQQMAKTADIFDDQWAELALQARQLGMDTMDDMRDWCEANQIDGRRWNTASMTPDSHVLAEIIKAFGSADEFLQSQMPGGQDPWNEKPGWDPFGDGTTARTAARRPKMCPVHDQLVNYALLVGPGEALSAFSGSLFGEHSCQGGYEMINKAGNPTKCRYKPEMVTQEYWDAKDAEAEAKQLEREQQQALLEQQQLQAQPLQPEPEGQLIGGPEYEAQQEQQAIEEKAPVTQDIPSLDGFQTEEDYIPAEQGANDADFAEQFAIAASYKWSGPTAELEAPEQMFSDTPPEEVPSGDASDPRGGHEDPTDMEGNPLKVGMTYEVLSPNNKGYIPDRYVITNVDPSLIEFEVESQKDLGQPFSFTSTLSTEQIANEGIQFRPTQDANPNARGEVEPTDSDNTKGSDVPGQVSDLDTGGNSKGAKTAMNYDDWMDFKRNEEYDGPGEYVPPTRAYTQGDLDEMFPEGMNDENVGTLNQMMDTDMARYDRGMQRNRDSEMEALRQEIAELKSRLGEDDGDADDQGDDYGWATRESKTAGRDYSPGEQRGFVNENGSARNLDKLDLSGTHYPTASEDPYADFLW